MAQAVELQFLDRYCADQGWAASERAARKARERLQEAMRREREELDRPEPSNAELARRFLAEAVPGCPDPLSELSWPPFSQVRRLRHDPAILRAAFLEPDAETVLDHFLGVLAGADDSASSRYESIERALRQVCRDRAAPIALVHGIVHRSCHALSDAFDDWRRFGPRPARAGGTYPLPGSPPGGHAGRSDEPAASPQDIPSSLPARVAVRCRPRRGGRVVSRRLTIGIKLTLIGLSIHEGLLTATGVLALALVLVLSWIEHDPDAPASTAAAVRAGAR